MKKNILVVLVMAVFFIILGASFVLATEPCPAGQSCSENFATTLPQNGAPVKTPIKKELSREEVAAYQKAVATARERDNDKTVVFTKTNETDRCYYWELENKIDELLMKSPDVVVDRKEYLTPSFAIEKIMPGSGRVFSKCTTAIVVHYHKKGGDKK
ncbi:MAG: hypothetical protein WCI36_03340 [bacterium]